MSVDVRTLTPEMLAEELLAAFGAAIRKHGESPELLRLSALVAAVQLVLRNRGLK